MISLNYIKTSWPSRNIIRMSRKIFRICLTRNVCNFIFSKVVPSGTSTSVYIFIRNSCTSSKNTNFSKFQLIWGWERERDSVRLQWFLFNQFFFFERMKIRVPSLHGSADKIFDHSRNIAATPVKICYRTPKFLAVVADRGTVSTSAHA